MSFIHSFIAYPHHHPRRYHSQCIGHLPRSQQRFVLTCEKLVRHLWNYLFKQKLPVHVLFMRPLRYINVSIIIIYIIIVSWQRRWQMKWMLRDEMVSSLRNSYPVTEDILKHVCSLSMCIVSYINVVHLKNIFVKLKLFESENVFIFI